MTIQAPPRSSWIGDDWAPCRGESFVRENPADRDDVMGPYFAAPAEEVEQAVQAARQSQPAWSARPAPVRGDLVARAGQLLRSRLETIAAELTREEGKTLTEARDELTYAAAVLEFMGAGGRWVAGEMIDSAHATTLVYTRRQPLGVVAAITPWNFPASLPAIKIGAALVAGNSVVWKPASWTPATALALTQCLVDAGLPPGVLQTLLGDARVGQRLVEDDRVRAVSFTGSTEVGQRLGAQLAARGARAQLELGGKNAIVVLEDADVAVAARDTALAAYQSAGQKCTAASRVIVVPEVREEFLEALVDHVRNLSVGEPTKSDTDIGPVVHERPLNEHLAAVAKATAGGARLLLGGARLGGDLDRGNYMSPALLDRVTPDMSVARQELFGPVLAVLDAADHTEALQIANGTDYGLAAAIYTRDLQRALHFAERCEAGKIKINSSTPGGDLHVPFGGWKASGAGPKELGHTALNFFTEEKTVYVNYLGEPR